MEEAQPVNSTCKRLRVGMNSSSQRELHKPRVSDGGQRSSKVAIGCVENVFTHIIMEKPVMHFKLGNVMTQCDVFLALQF
jgi:hypothetical protein